MPERAVDAPDEHLQVARTPGDRRGVNGDSSRWGFQAVVPSGPAVAGPPPVPERDVAAADEHLQVVRAPGDRRGVTGDAAVQAIPAGPAAEGILGLEGESVLASIAAEHQRLAHNLPRSG